MYDCSHLKDIVNNDGKMKLMEIQLNKIYNENHIIKKIKSSGDWKDNVDNCYEFLNKVKLILKDHFLDEEYSSLIDANFDELQSNFMEIAEERESFDNDPEVIAEREADRKYQEYVDAGV